MFGRHMEVSFVKNKKAQSQPEPESTEPVDYAEIAERLGTKLVIGIVAVMAANFVLGTATHLIVQATGKHTAE